MKKPFSKKGPCPASEELARYRFTEGRERDRMDHHLAGCTDCLESIDIGNRFDPESEQPPEALLRRIQSLPFRTALRRSRRKVVSSPGRPVLRYAVAMGLLFSIGVFLYFAPRSSEKNPPVQAQTPGEKEKVQKQKRPPLQPVVPVPSPDKKKIVPGPEKEEVVRMIPVRKETSPLPVPGKNPKPEPIPEPGTGPETTIARVSIGKISGSLLHSGKAISSGEQVAPGDLLQTPFGREARLEFSGVVLWMDHRTQVRLEKGPRVTLVRGKIFLRSAPGLEVWTPVGTLIPIGTEFQVETGEKGSTTVIVKEGKVRFQNHKGKREVPAGCRSTGKAGRKPGPAERLRKLSSLFAWVDSVDRAVAPGPGAFVRLYPTGSRSPLVITAPHVPVETQSREIAAFLAETLEVPLVVGTGYKGRVPRVDLNEPGANEESRGAYLEYAGAIRSAADRLPLPFLVEIHAYGNKNSETPVIEISTSGFTRGELERIKKIYAGLLEKIQPEIRARLVFDLTDPKYEVDGKTRNFKYGSSVLRKTGVFQKQFVQRGWKVELPWIVRYSVQEHYRTILAELIRSVRH